MTKKIEIDGIKLGNWIVTQRIRKHLLNSDRIKRLNSIGFSWDPVSDQWEKAFSALKKFHKREGHCLVPNYHIEDGLHLGAWVNKQRQRKKHLTDEQIYRLGAIDFSWNPYTENWEASFKALQEFQRKEGHCLVSSKLKLGGINLGMWVNSQRQRKDKLTADQVKRLNAIGFIWSVLEKQWEEAFNALQEFRKTEGHCRVYAKYEVNGLKLGRWVFNQRYQKKGTHTPEQLKRLNSLDFIW